MQGGTGHTLVVEVAHDTRRAGLGTLSLDSAAEGTPHGFILGRVIGRGGAGVVHEARQGSTGRTVAVKILGPADGEVSRRFERERTAMAELAGHPSIVSILDAGVKDGRPWLAMDLCPLGSLARLDRPMPLAEVLTTVHAVAGALQTAHARGILHCDVKPANILVTGYGRPALSDFGIARLGVGGHPSTTAGAFTLDHVAPEVLEGVRPTDRADVFSLGTTAWQLLAGRPPFRRQHDTGIASVLRRIQREALPALPRDDVPDSVAELLVAMTAKDPRARPDAAEVVARVEDVARRSGLALGASLSGTATFLRALAPPSDSLTTGSLPTAPAAAPHGLSSASGGWTDHRPDLADLTRGGRLAAVAPPPPVVPATPDQARRDPVVVVALVAVVTVVLALGGLTTSRLLPNGPIATSTLVAPAGAATGPEAPAAPAAEGAPQAVSLGVAAGAAPLPQPAGRRGSGPSPQGAPGTPSAPGVRAGGGGQPPPPTTPGGPSGSTLPTLSSIDLTNGNCTYSAAAGTCTQTSTTMSYVVKAVNSDGALPVTGCTATNTLVNAAGTARSLASVPCNSTRVTATTPVGHYTVKVTVSYHGSQLSRSFDLTVT